MKTWCGAGALLLGAVILEGCAASPMQGAQVRAHPTSAAFEHSASSEAVLAQRLERSERKESPLVHACRAGNSKSCNELGDRLAIKHAYAEGLQWYEISCERVRGSMEPTARRLLQLSQNVTEIASLHSDEEQGDTAKQTKLAQLKSDASEIRARIQGCFDTGEILKTDGELKQSLAYYDAVCEFSTLVKAVDEAVPGLQLVTESGCAASQSARAKLNSKTPFSPQLFVDLTGQQPKTGAAAQGAAQGEASMVFNTGDL